MRKSFLSGIFALLCWDGAATAQPAELLVAARSGDLDAVVELLQSGVDPDPEGTATPLYFAAQGGHFEIAEQLIEHGADPNALSNWGTPLQIASRRGYLGIVNLLLENSANPNLSGGESNKVPLHEAAETNNVEIARQLIEKGADVNARATGRVSGPPLHFALYRGNLEVAEVLKRAGAVALPAEPITRAEFEAADLDYGKARATQCTPCHTLTPGRAGERGPSLWNIVGRPVASMPEFPYTQPMQEFGGVWTYERLNQFIRDVRGTVPGTEMYTGDLPEKSDRIALIAYLRLISDAPPPLPID